MLRQLINHFCKKSLKEKMQSLRQSKLNSNSDSLPSESLGFVEGIRNIAIIAHIDAGKTTLTERLLYFCGALSYMGEVHDGSSLMDYLPEEQRRGITIGAAAVTFKWKEAQINLIDTPGHIDFNFEVERSLRVLDGALVVLDASKGVEAQTEIVWRQAERYSLSKVCVINKMDKQGADFSKSIKNLEERFGVRVLPIYWPIFSNEEFIGVFNFLEGTKQLFAPEFE